MKQDGRKCRSESVQRYRCKHNISIFERDGCQQVGLKVVPSCNNHCNSITIQQISVLVQSVAFFGSFNEPRGNLSHGEDKVMDLDTDIHQVFQLYSKSKEES